MAEGNRVLGQSNRWARMVHLAGAYWGLLFLGLHGGLHTALPGRFKVSAIKNVVDRKSVV